MIREILPEDKNNFVRNLTMPWELRVTLISSETIYALGFRVVFIYIYVIREILPEDKNNFVRNLTMPWDLELSLYIFM